MVSNIFILDKNLKTKLILSINGHNTFFKDLYDLDLSTGTESYEFSTTAEDINESDYIMFHYHGDYKLFQIIDIEQEHREGKIITSVYGESACLELLNGVTDPIMNEEGKALSMTAGEFIDRVLTRSDWQRKRYSSSLDNKVVDVKIEKTRQIWPVIQEYMKEFGYEITTRVKYENGYVKKKYIDVYAEGELGNKTCKRFEYNRNVKGITKKKNLYDFCTALILETKQDTQGIMYGIKDGNTLKPKDGIIKGPDANAVLAVDNNKIYNAGKDWIYGVYEDNDSGSGTEAVEKAAKELKARSVPKFDYECDTAVSYEEYENINIGDTVYVIDHTFNPIITLEARVGKLEISFTDRDNCKCTLSNYKEIKTRITADDSHIKELLDKTTIQYGDKDTGQDEITLKDDYLNTKDKVDELENMLKNHIDDCGGNLDLVDPIVTGTIRIKEHSNNIYEDEYGDRGHGEIGTTIYDELILSGRKTVSLCLHPVTSGIPEEYRRALTFHHSQGYLNGKTEWVTGSLNAEEMDITGNRISITGQNRVDIKNLITSGNTYIAGGKTITTDEDGNLDNWHGKIEAVNCADPQDSYGKYFDNWLGVGGIYENGTCSGVSIKGKDALFLGANRNPEMIQIINSDEPFMIHEFYDIDDPDRFRFSVSQLVSFYAFVSMRDLSCTGDLFATTITGPIKNYDYDEGSFRIHWGYIDMCMLSSDLDAKGWGITNLGDSTKSVSSQSEYTASLINSGTIENVMHSNLSYDSGELRWCHKENVFTYPESDVDPETDEWVYTGRYICYVELPIFMAENIQNDYHINVCKKSWGDYRIVEQDPYYFILESQEDNFAFTFEVVAKLNDNQTLNHNAIVANKGISELEKIDKQVDED